MGGRGGSFVSHSNRSDSYKFFGVGNAGSSYEMWHRSIDEDEEYEVTRYTGNWYGMVNSVLRSRDFYDDLEPDEQMEVDDSIAALDSAISKFDLKKNLTVFRGSSSTLVGGYDTAEEINSNLKGAIVQDRAYMSTTANKRDMLVDDITYEIKVPKGKGRGAFVAPISKAKSEDEFLLKRGTKFKVLGATKRDWQVVVKLLVVG